MARDSLNPPGTVNSMQTREAQERPKYKGVTLRLIAQDYGVEPEVLKAAIRNLAAEQKAA